jgi:hypothetical protein
MSTTSKPSDYDYSKGSFFGGFVGVVDGAVEGAIVLVLVVAGRALEFVVGGATVCDAATVDVTVLTSGAFVGGADGAAEAEGEKGSEVLSVEATVAVLGNAGTAFGDELAPDTAAAL